MTLRRHGSKVFKIYSLVEKACLVSFIVLPVLIAWFVRLHRIAEEDGGSIGHAISHVTELTHHNFGHHRLHNA